MDNDLIKILLYAGAAIIYFIFKNRKKFKENAPSTSRPSTQERNSPDNDDDDPFEQLLKEVAQKWEEKEAPVKPVFVNSSHNRMKHVKQQAYSSTSELSLEGQGERQLIGLMGQAGKNEGMSEEDRSLLDKNKEFKKFKEYETKMRVNPYHDLSKDPKRLREAFVMGEILQRKY
jgi:hypothetical protein